MRVNERCLFTEFRKLAWRIVEGNAPEYVAIPKQHGTERGLTNPASLDFHGTRVP